MAERTEIPKTSNVNCILPYLISILTFRTMIDTPANREAMPNEDHSKWLPPEKIGELLRQWADGENRPENGAFAKLAFSKGAIVPEFV